MQGVGREGRAKAAATIEEQRLRLVRVKFLDIALNHSLADMLGADDMVAMGAVNASVPHAELEATALQWGREVTSKSPMAQRMLKFAFNMIDDGLVGQQIFAGEATRLGYMTDEAQEGRDSFLEKRDADFGDFPWHY